MRKGTENTAILFNYLWSNNRGQDAIKAGEDHDYYLKLLREYNEIHPEHILAEDIEAYEE